MAKAIGIVSDDTEERTPARRRIKAIGTIERPGPVQASIFGTGTAAEQAPAAQAPVMAPATTEGYEVGGITFSPTQYPSQVPRIERPAGAVEVVPSTQAMPYFKGVGQRALGLGELALQGITGGAGQVVGGLGGLAKTITSGVEAGAETVRQAQEAMTYQPRGLGAKEAMGALSRGAETAAPVLKPAIKGFEAAREKAGEIAGPAGYAAVGTLPAAITELMGLRIARNAKKQILKKLIKESAREDVIDAGGAIKQGVKQAMDETGLKSTEMLPLLGSEVERQAEQIGKAITAGPFRQKRAAEKLSEMIKVDPEIVKIAREFGVDSDLPTGVATKDYSHQRVIQGLASVAGSKTAERMHNFTIKMAEKAKNLIEEIGGTTEKTELSDLYRETGKKMLEDMGEQTRKIYNQVNTEIVRRAGKKAVPVEAPATLEYVNDILERRGNKMQRLDPLERELLKELDPAEEPTYDWLDQLRQDVGQALEGKKTDPIYADKDRDQLKALYAVLATDQEQAAAKYGLAETFNEARALHATRMGIQDKFIKTLGKEWTTAITQKAREAILQLGKKNPKAWDELIKNLPPEMGPEFRKQIVATSVYDAMIGGQAMRGNMSAKAFSDFMSSMTDNRAARDRLIKEIGTENFNRLNRFGKLVTQMHRAATKQEYTGKIMSVPGIIDEIEGITERIYGKLPSTSRTQRSIETIFQGQKSKKSALGDALLDDPKFRDKLFQKATDQMDAKQISRADAVLMENPTFKQWMETLGPTELKTLMAVGPLGYLTGEGIKKVEDTEQ